MSRLGAAQLLQVWEQGLDREPAARALVMLAAAVPGTDPSELAFWPLGRRDAALLRWRTELFGPDLEALLQCPGCGGDVELTFPAAMLEGETPIDAGQPDGQLAVLRGGYSLTLRAVTSADLLALLSPDPEAELVRRCVTSATAGGTSVEPAALPVDVLDTLGAELAAADPAATTDLAVECPDCGHAWLAPFHIAGYLWAELHHWAGRMLLDIHALAGAYGWSEADILALPPRRRQAYLELVAP
ncbi:hypothetical protein AAGW05_01930 [Arthrobacter sp. LAPM80]|uniref:T4 family baseplate hub assembly chaperone n=1 Tax=Arthrobacter sp. LAPM80 TaxID=3141788 RepID=UPI00398AF04D